MTSYTRAKHSQTPTRVTVSMSMTSPGEWKSSSRACHELGDWIEESTALPAKEYAKQPPTLEVCDAVAQTAKHHTRRQSGSRITAIVVKLYGDQIWHSRRRRVE